VAGVVARAETARHALLAPPGRHCRRLVLLVRLCVCNHSKSYQGKLSKGCTRLLACKSAPSVHVMHQSVVATFKHGVNQEDTSASVKDTGRHAAHAVTQGRVILREQAVPVGVHRHHRARRVHPDGPAVDAAQLFCRTGTSPTHC